MSALSRRDFLAGNRAGCALALSCSRARRTAPWGRTTSSISSSRRRGARSEPALRGKRDIGIRFGNIEAVERDIPAARALRVLNAEKLVTPGLVDLHCHVFPYGSAIGIPADEPWRSKARPCVSAGDAGASNFAALPPLRGGADPHAPLRLRAHRQYRADGLSGAELYNIDFAQPDAARKRRRESDIALGAKVRMSENVIAKHGLEPLKRAILACEQAGDRREGDVSHRWRRAARS